MTKNKVKKNKTRKAWAGVVYGHIDSGFYLGGIFDDDFQPSLMAIFKSEQAAKTVYEKVVPVKITFLTRKVKR